MDLLRRALELLVDLDQVSIFLFKTGQLMLELVYAFVLLGYLKFPLDKIVLKELNRGLAEEFALFQLVLCVQ